MSRVTRGGDHYFASASPDDIERERIHCLEAMFDRVTIARFERIGIQAGWSCLEVGAGGGSMACWLGERVGTAGSVLATDKDTRFLGHLREPVTVQTLDLHKDDVPRSAFDLVHCRMVLMHLSEPSEVLRRLVAAVKPGGWLLIEEGDYSTCAAVNRDDPEGAAWSEAWQALIQKLTAAGVVDSYFGRKLRGLADELGLEQSGGDGVTAILRGGEAGARFWELSFEAAHVAGLVTDLERARTAKLMHDPSFLFSDAMLFGVWGRVPA